MTIPKNLVLFWLFFLDFLKIFHKSDLLGGALRVNIVIIWLIVSFVKVIWKFLDSLELQWEPFNVIDG